MDASLKDSSADLALSMGRRIRQRRWQRGETQLDLADRLGISFRELQLLESGVRNVPLPLLKRIAKVQETPLDYYTDALDALNPPQ